MNSEVRRKKSKGRAREAPAFAFPAVPVE